MTMHLLTFVLVAFVSAQGQSVPPDLQKAIDARRTAQASRDVDTWNRHTSDDFVLVDADGMVKSKAQRGADIKAGLGPGAKFTEERARMYGDTAIITNLQGNVRFTSVWVKQAGVWRMASAHSSRVK
jgi:ketosteroid isomerase-like protein